MRFAYADPPYLGCCGLYGHVHDGPLMSGCWDEIETHEHLITQVLETYDGWAMSLSSPSLRDLLPLCEDNVRVAAWVKPFAAFKPNVNPAYTWEPVIFVGGRRGDRERATVRDWHAANITLQKGLTGAKSESFCAWVLDLLGYEDGDELHDLFPGTGVMAHVLANRQMRFAL